MTTTLKPITHVIYEKCTKCSNLKGRPGQTGLVNVASSKFTHVVVKSWRSKRMLWIQRGEAGTSTLLFPWQRKVDFP
jgi:hypothetical protein